MLGLVEIKVNQFPAWQYFMQPVSILGHMVYRLITEIELNNQKARNAISEVKHLIKCGILFKGKDSCFFPLQLKANWLKT